MVVMVGSLTMETNKQDNLWDSDKCYQGKKEGFYDGDIEVVGQGWHLRDKKVPFMSRDGGRELWAAGSSAKARACGFMALNLVLLAC